MDVLSDVLGAVRLTGAIFFDRHLSDPWVGESPPAARVAGSVMPDAESIIQFHAIIDGACWAAVPGAGDLYAERGDVVIVPHGDVCIVSSERGMRAPPADLAEYFRPANRPLPFLMRQGGNGPQSCRMICGYLGCSARPFNPILESLPRLFEMRMSEVSRGWIESMVQVAAEETEHGHAGAEAMLAKLAELMFVEVLRKYIDQLPEDSSGWLPALRDRHLSQAIRLIHGQPARAWTIDSLAREIGLSRSAFAHRFTNMIGTSPMNYLARWRMQLASRRLEAPGVSVAQVGAEVGYESEAAFSRAFKKFVGRPPGTWRRAHWAPEAIRALPIEQPPPLG